jgi:hypothetical protein
MNIIELVYSIGANMIRIFPNDFMTFYVSQLYMRAYYIFYIFAIDFRLSYLFKK